MGTVPVFRAVQRPRNADAYCVVLLQFRHIVAQSDEKDADQYGDNDTHFYLHTESSSVSNAVYNNRHYRNDPESQCKRLFVDIAPLRVIKGDK